MRPVKSVTTLMEHKAGEKEIEFQYNFASEPVTITGDEQQLEQALINIVKNAIEAIDRKGIISFTTTDHPKKLIITDTGKGIVNEDAEHLFSPFFSTKKDGQGIGLTLVKEILFNHQFEFSLKTIEPQKTVFYIKFLPNRLIL